MLDPHRWRVRSIALLVWAGLSRSEDTDVLRARTKRLDVVKESMLFVRERRKRFCYSSYELDWFELGTYLLSLVIFIVMLKERILPLKKRKEETIFISHFSLGSSRQL